MQINVKIDWIKIFNVGLILAGAIVSNILYDMPALGVWIAIIIGAFIRPVPWKEVPGAIKGTIFLLCLVFCASMMPVEELPDASWVTAFHSDFFQQYLIISLLQNFVLIRVIMTGECWHTV